MKITIKPYLNTKLNPIIIDGESFLPLYYQIIYNRESTQLKSIKNKVIPENEDMYKNSKYLINYETNVIRSILEYENKINMKCGLKGLNKRYEVYQNDLYHSLYEYTNMAILKAVDKKNNEFSSVIKNAADGNTNPALLYRAANKLIGNIDDQLLPDIRLILQEENQIKSAIKTISLQGDIYNTLIYWFNNKSKELIKKELMLIYKNQKKTEKIIESMDEALKMPKAILYVNFLSNM